MNSLHFSMGNTFRKARNYNLETEYKSVVIILNWEERFFSVEKYQ